MTKICHVSDIHIRGLEYHDEIKYTFEQLYQSIEEKKCELTVVCGDLFHSKTQVTSEYFVTVTEFLDNLVKLTDVVVIPGNHDAILNNPTRIDAITPVVNSLLKSNSYKNQLIYSKKTERIHLPKYNIKFYHYSIFDNKAKWNKSKELDDKFINICLYHGSINNSKLDNDWISRGNRDDISLFDDFDYAFLGDIHVRQFLTPKIAYPGSLRQNNYGEDLAKGYILWEINDKDKFKSEEITLPQKRYFFTINIQDEKDLNGLKIPYKDCRIRVNVDKTLNFQEENKIRNKIKLLYSPCNEVPILSLDRKHQSSQIKLGSSIINNENIRDPDVQKKLIEEYLKDKNIDQKVIDAVCELDKKYNFSINKEHLKRNIIWKPEFLKWNNFLSYGENNELDFSKLGGLVGIFGRNAQGKSSIIDSIMYALDSAVMREGANRNIDYINNHKMKCDVELTTVCQDDKYIISRSTTKKVSKSGDEKANSEVSFTKIKDGKPISLNGEDAPKTNIEIRKIFGTSEDFSITSLCSQWGLSKFIDAKGTERKKTFAKLLDLEIFEEKYKIAYEDFLSVKEKIKVLDNPNISKELFDVRKNITTLKEQHNKIYWDEIIPNARKIGEKKVAIDELRLQYNSDVKVFLQKEQLKIDCEQLQRKIDDLNKNQIVNLTIELDDINTKLTQMNLFSSEQVRLKNDLAQDKKRELNKIQTSLNHDDLIIDITKKRISLIERSPNQEICKKCDLLKDAFSAKDELIDLEKQKNIHFEQFQQEKLKQIDTSNFNEAFNLFTKQKQLHEKIIKNNELINSLTAQFVSKQNELNFIIENDEKIRKNSQIIFDIKKLEEEMRFLQDIDANLFAKREELVKQQALKEAELTIKQEQKTKFDKLSKEYDLYDVYLDAMGKNGISYMILSKKIPLINDEINSILANIVDFKINIENNEEEKTLKIYVVDKFKKRIIELCSGFEKTVVAIALRTALWKISNLPKAPLLILDEAFGFLNNEKMDSIINFLTYLKNYFETILIISHNDDLKTMMDHIIFVEKDSEGFSQIRI